MRAEPDDSRCEDDTVDSAVVDNQLRDDSAILGFCDVAFATRGPQHETTTSLDFVRDAAAQATCRTGDEKDLVAQLHATMFVQRDQARLTVPHMSHALTSAGNHPFRFRPTVARTGTVPAA